jgi:hypothetical protein
MLAISLAAATPILPSADGARSLLASCGANAYPALTTTAHLPPSIQAPIGIRHEHRSATLHAHIEHIEDTARIHIEHTPITAGTHFAYLLITYLKSGRQMTRHTSAAYRHLSVQATSTVIKRNLLVR